MSFSIIKYLNDIFTFDDVLSEIGITIYTSEGKIKNMATILEEIAELWNKDLEEKIKNDCC